VALTNRDLLAEAMTRWVDRDIPCAMGSLRAKRLFFYNRFYNGSLCSCGFRIAHGIEDSLSIFSSIIKAMARSARTQLQRHHLQRRQRRRQVG